MDSFNEEIIIYGDLILGDDVVRDLRCKLLLNKVDTSNIFAEISIPSSIRVKLHNVIRLQENFIFKTENKNKSVYIEATRSEIHDKFTWEASLILYPYKVVTLDNYLESEITQAVFRAFLTPSELLFNEAHLTYHESRGLISGWDVLKNPNKPEWIENNFKYNSEIGEIELIPGFIFKEDKEDKYKKHFNIIRQLIIYCKVELSHKLSFIDAESIFNKEVERLGKSLALVFVKRMNSWFSEVYTKNNEKDIVSEQRTFLRISKKTPLKDNRFLYGEPYNRLRPTLLSTIKALSDAPPDRLVIFNKLLDRYLVAFTYDKIDTQIIYALSCLDLIRNHFDDGKRGRMPFTPNLILVCETNNIEWLDLFPYLAKENVFDKDIKEDMYLNDVRNQIIHHGIYPDDYNRAQDEILKARTLCERFILKLLDIDYNNTCLGKLTRY